MSDLIRSFCFRLVSLFVHHAGRLYSQSKPKFLHARHRGFSSEHFFLLNLQVKQPDRDRRCIFDDLGDELLVVLVDAGIVSGCCAITIVKVVY